MGRYTILLLSSIFTAIMGQKNEIHLLTPASIHFTSNTQIQQSVQVLPTCNFILI